MEDNEKAAATHCCDSSITCLESYVGHRPVVLPKRRTKSEGDCCCTTREHGIAAEEVVKKSTRYDDRAFAM